MAIVEINASKKYSIYIERGLLDRIGYLCENILPGKNAVLITDDTVNALYGDRVETALQNSGFAVHRLVLPAGEETKSLAQFGTTLEFLAENKLTRTDTVFALGGGVIGDLAGFASAVYLRGIRYIQIPTTLLAAVDSSVGGKTAIDLSAGKNLAGAFHQPDAVFCDPDVLQTLLPETFSDGCAEVIKYAVLDGEPLYSMLNDPLCADWAEIIRACVTIKKRMVEEDEFDTGVRMFLNLGHTVGHAIEKKSSYAITHGKAVAIGMVIASQISKHIGLCNSTVTKQIIELLKKYELPTVSPYDASLLVGEMLSDKKRAGDSLHLILPEQIGKCIVYKINIDELAHLLESSVNNN